MRTQWFVYNAGQISCNDEIKRFSFVAPSYAKKLVGLYVFSPDLANQAPKFEDIQLSLLINNEAQISVCHSFSLGMNCIDENLLVGQMLKLDAPIIKGERISGYIEKLKGSTNWDTAEIKLHLKFEVYED